MGKCDGLKFLHTSFEPTDNEIVHDRHYPGNANSVVSSDVGDDVNLGGEGNVGANKLAP